MSLTICPDCGGKVSQRAALCIHCGAPISKGSRSYPQTYVAIVAVGIITLVALAAYKLFWPTTVFNPPPVAAMPQRAVMPELEVGPYARAIIESDKVTGTPNEKRKYGLLAEREIVTNQMAPRLLGPTLKLLDVNYIADEDVFEYNFRTFDSQLAEIEDLGQRLRRNYCQAADYELLRTLGTKARWYYWDKSGTLLFTHESMRCP